MTNKNIDKKFNFGISSKTFIIITLLIGLVISSLIANHSPIDSVYAEQQQEQIQQHQQQHQIKEDNKKKEVFHTLTSMSLSSPSSSLTSLASSNGVKHNIEMVITTL